MSENIIKDRTSTSSGSYKFFLDNYDNFKPIKRLVVFFNSENFLLTPYRVEGNHVHMVLENWRGQQLHINNMNCGYGGEGPSTTSNLLQYIGINESYAEQLKFYDGLQMSFDENGNLIESKISTDVFFGLNHRHRECEFYLNKYIYVDLNSKKVYMINPQLSDFKGLLSLVMKMKVKEMEYYIGDNSPLENGFRFNDDFKLFKGTNFRLDDDITSGVHGVNLIIRGEIFDIICLVKKDHLMILLNHIYLYLCKKNLFNIRLFDNSVTTLSVKKLSFSSIIFYCWQKLLNKNERYVHEVIKVENLNKEKKNGYGYLGNN